MNVIYNCNKCKYINICKYIKKTAYINKNIIHFNIKISNIDNNSIISMIITHNELLDKFEKLYIKFMNLIEYIQQTGSNIFNLDKMRIQDIKTHIINKSCKVNIERLNTQIIYYLNDIDIKLLYNYLIERKQDLYDKIEKLISLIKRLDEMTNLFKKRLDNL